MPDIEISEDQQAFLDDLIADLTEEHVGEYGAVRYRDALQFLIDRYRTGDDGQAGPESATGTQEEDARGSTPGSGEDRLEAMMNLLDTHDDKWEAIEGDEGNYVVTLPGGGTEAARTRDDVRALLFRHYG